jgi:hypothetical protein
MRRLNPNFFVVVITFLLSATAYSQEHNNVGSRGSDAVTVRLGSSAVVIPAPEGFEEATSQFENVKTKFTATEAPENEMLLVHLLSSDCDLLRRGQPATMNQYTKVSVLKTVKEQDFSQSELADIVAEFRKNGAALLDPNGPNMKGLLEHLDQALKNTTSTNSSMEMTQPVNMGEFEVSPNIYSVMLLLTFKRGAGETTPILAGLSYMRLKQRLVYAFTYRRYNSKADVEALKTFSQTWTASILAAN